MHGKIKLRIPAFIILLVCLFIASSAALAGTSVGSGNSANLPEDQALQDRLRQVPAFLFKVHKDGIGYGTCPVYSAPSVDAFRANNGKAACGTDEHIDEAGYDASGWLLVRYETNNGACRVGYIPPKYVKGFKSPMPTPQFDYIPVTADDIVYVSDNPLLNSSYFATLEPGETFYILGKYTYIGDWWYIECTVDNQLARGFINRETSSFILGDQTINKDTYVPEAVLSPLGTEKIGTLTVGYGTDGAHKTIRQDADPDSKQLALVSPGEKYPCYAEKKGTNGKPWYYIWIEKESVWGWISSGVSTLAQ